MSALVGIFQALASTDPEENYLAASPTPSIASRYTSSISSALLSPSCTLVDEYEVDWYTMLPTCKSDKGAVLGKQTLAKLVNDLDNTEYPSFMKKPRHTVGQTGSGKIKAVELKTFTTVTLVSSLVHLWGPQPPASHYQS